MCRLRVGHTWLTQSYLLKNEVQPFCYACDSLYTVRHILIECPDFQDTRRKYFSVTDMYRLFREVAQYIGEICRYLLAQPPRPEEQQHLVRVMFGNGIKPQIWPQFQQRFGIKLIGEFYGATEGNCNIVNFENKVGAVGFCTRIAPFLYPITLVKVDPHTNNIVRDRDGVCVLAKPVWGPEKECAPPWLPRQGRLSPMDCLSSGLVTTIWPLKPAAVCVRCGKGGHAERDCLADPHCLNCRGDHAASSKTCPKFLEEQAILHYKAENGDTFQQARKAVVIELHKMISTGTFASAVKTQLRMKPAALPKGRKAQKNSLALSPQRATETEVPVTGPKNKKDRRTLGKHSMVLRLWRWMLRILYPQFGGIPPPPAP
ncbi:long-chain fatty acid transport protein [Plakobranchus ocellatus]|uniref:Long-chain fatty acid transport protein n=1 Tax=Plakobranchus ocellatus TaxID=259542 RepID=A0AAV4C003_9GAST|nr:long-chain fatty acid transport protein [Plakobranchus ocellatus]